MFRRSDHPSGFSVPYTLFGMPFERRSAGAIVSGAPGAGSGGWRLTVDVDRTLPTTRARAHPFRRALRRIEWVEALLHPGYSAQVDPI